MVSPKWHYAEEFQHVCCRSFDMRENQYLDSNKVSLDRYTFLSKALCETFIVR